MSTVQPVDAVSTAQPRNGGSKSSVAPGGAGTIVGATSGRNYEGTLFYCFPEEGIAPVGGAEAPDEAE